MKQAFVPFLEKSTKKDYEMFLLHHAI